ncbi:hypothetical protein R6K74_12275, partial [Enterococcus faecium]|nr:hypothetical protein [Enterococcus faecium]
MNLNFRSVIERNFELVYKIPKEVGERYEELTSFDKGRDFNKEIREYVISFVEQFSEFLTPENERQFNRIRQKSPILYRWVMNAVRYEGYR